MSSRKLTTHLLILAENDDFQTSLHILLTSTSTPTQSSSKAKLNLNRRTSDGDYLITLSSYAACEKATDMQSRIYALKCLKYILDRDFTAVNKVAGDGGSALHCALAAASCFNDNTNTNINDDDDDDDDDDDNINDNSDSDSEEEDDSDEEEGRDKEYIKELKSQVTKDNNISILDQYCPEFANLSSDEITILTIHLLLSNEADVNLPLANVHHIDDRRSSTDDNGNGNGNDNDSDEIELAYAREAIINQWTPLMFAIQMIILASQNLETCKNDDNDDRSSSSSLALSILIFQLLLQAGADPSYMMAASNNLNNNNNNNGDWNAFHVLGTSCHILSKIKVESNTIEQINDLFQSSLQYLKLLDQETHITKINENVVASNIDDDNDNNKTVRRTVYDCLQYIIANILKDDDYQLSSLQSFTIAIMTNDLKKAQSILERRTTCHTIGTETLVDHRTDLLQKWRTMKYSTIFPLFQSIWDYNSFCSKTLLDIASFCNAVDSLRLLVGSDDDFAMISEEQLRNSIQSVFMSYESDTTNNNAELELSKDQYLSLLILLGMENKNQIIVDNDVNDGDNDGDDNFFNKRQRILDRLLMESCSRTPWAQNVPNSTLILLILGADPNITSIANEVQNSLSPLHLVAGNFRGIHGIEKVDYLLGKRIQMGVLKLSSSSVRCADLFAKTRKDNDLPLYIALQKKNFHVAKRLFEAMGGGGVDDSNHIPNNTLIKWDIEKASLLGEAAIECTSVDLFQSAVNIMKRCLLSEDKEVTYTSFSRAVGKLLLWAVDERSGFGSKRSQLSNEEICSKLRQIVDIISQVQDEIQEMSISSWARDEISGQTPLHLILRNDRGLVLRSVLLPPLCTIMLKDDKISKSDDNDDEDVDEDSSSYFVSLPCSGKFGSYTALHLACALGCEESVKVLLESNADPTLLTSDNKAPINMIPKDVSFSKEVERRLYA